MSTSAIDDARRRHKILKALVRRERDYTKGYKNLSRLYEIGVLEKGMIGDVSQLAQDTLDALDQVVDALGFLDIVSSFEAAAYERIETLTAATRGVLRAQIDARTLAPAAGNLVRNSDEFATSLKKIFDVVRIGAAPGDAENISQINDARNDIAHGRTPKDTLMTHSELAALLTRLVERQLTRP